MKTGIAPPGGSLRSAEDDARRYTQRAGVQIRNLHNPGEMAAASALLARVWKTEGNHSHLDPGLLVALAHAENYVSGAFRDERLVAVCVGFFHPPAHGALHSHIAGVAPEFAGAGIGKALKFHQRAWAISMGAIAMTWTFDPLVARNAYFNLHRLGVDVTAYLPDFYGDMSDGVNRGSPSDRMLLTWNLVGPGPRPDRDDEPAAAPLRRVGDAPVLAMEDAGRAASVRIDLPRDIEALRSTDPQLAAQWRTGVRTAFTALLDEGWIVSDFDRRGFYRLERTPACVSSQSN